jgi:hypothetical protein
MTNTLADSSLQKLTQNIQNKNYILKLQNFKYLLNIKVKNSKSYIQLTEETNRNVNYRYISNIDWRNLYYDHRNLFECNQINRSIFYPNRINSLININLLFLIEQLFGWERRFIKLIVNRIFYG